MLKTKKKQSKTIRKWLPTTRESHNTARKYKKRHGNAKNRAEMPHNGVKSHFRRVFFISAGNSAKRKQKSHGKILFNDPEQPKN